MLAIGYLFVTIWFCVPVVVSGLGFVSPAIAVALFIFFVLSAAVLMPHVFPEQQLGIVFTIGYGALLSSIIFG